MATTMVDNFKFSLDIHFAQKLAGNFTKIRERTVKKLKRWIAARSFKQGGEGMEDELMRLWKGLFYCMWMCDKPVVQEDLADKIADLIHSFKTPQGAMVFFDSFLLTMKREWQGIDRLRMDKFFMFVRRCFRQVLVVLRNHDWEDSVVDRFLAVLCRTPLSINPEACPDGLRYHFIDIYREELAVCAGKELTPSDQVMKLIEPFCVLVTSTRNKTLCKVILQGFFQDIVDESDVGFPEEFEDEGIESGEEGKDESEEDEEAEEEGNMDEGAGEITEEEKKFPRKEIPKLQYDYQAVADRLFTLASQESTPGGVRRKVYAMVKKFRDLKEGVFPDYNIESLLNYQDDEEEDESKYAFRVPKVKEKKSRRRGGKQVRERRLARAESAEDGSIPEKGQDGKKRRRRRRKKKQTDSSQDETEGANTAGPKDTKTSPSPSQQSDGIPTEGGATLELETSGKIQKNQDRNQLIEKAEDVQHVEAVDGGAKKSKRKAKKRKSSTPESEGAKPTDENHEAVTEETGQEVVKSVISTDKPKGKAKKRKSVSDAEGQDHQVDPKPKKTDKESSVSAVSSVSDMKTVNTLKGGSKKRKSVVVSEKQDLQVAGAVGKLDGNSSGSDLKSQLQLNLSKPGKESSPLSSSSRDTEVGVDPAPTANTTGLLSGSGKLPHTPSTGRKQSKVQPFATFQDVRPPSALARRRPVRSQDEPQSEPPRIKKSRLSGVLTDADPQSEATPRKRVKIALGLNQLHASKDYKKQLESSPGIPYDGSKKPTQSVLKTPSPKPPRQPKKKKAATPTFKTPSPGVQQSKVKSGSKKSPKSSGPRRSTRIHQKDV